MIRTIGNIKIGSLTSTITSYFLNIKSKTVKGDIIENIKSRIDDLDNLSDEDINDICSVLKRLNKQLFLKAT